MCVKNHIKRVYVLLNVSQIRPQVVGVVKQYPLYRQIYEDTKHIQLNRAQVERMGLKFNPDGKIHMIEVEIPIDKLC